MITVTSGFLDAVRGSHGHSLRVALAYDGATVTDDLPITGGTLTLDLDDESYATAELDLADPDWLATDLATSPLLPYGHRLSIQVGILVGPTVEWITVGPELLLTSVPTWAGAASDVRLTARSLIRQVQDDRFTVPYQPTGNVRAAITALLQAAVPGATVTHVGDDASIPAGLLWEAERWDAARDLAARVDAVIRPYGSGFRVAAPPAIGVTGVWTVDAGDTGVLLPGALPALSRDDVHNGVVAANPDDPAVWALATISDPADPLRWGGPMGHRPFFYSSPLLTTAGQASAAAATRLANLLGRSRTVELGCLPNPALEPGDTVTVAWPDSDPELMMVRKLVLNLAGGEMRLTLQGAGT
ncbi:MAG: DUF5047 domain-containing protein [Candidatus Nanopelagicales bacterium]